LAIHVNSAEILPNFAKHLDQAMTCCLRDLQEIKFGPKIMAAPDVDLLPSMLEAQSTSQNAVKETGLVSTAG